MAPFSVTSNLELPVTVKVEPFPSVASPLISAFFETVISVFLLSVSFKAASSGP